eukprot:CAMPEP_0185020246 /NCGR_PEP_ID=MMETSP1103-20130426/2846_1 /TAXON_ID=36769 /ORGANISM="Paraphysomonas bandaiensis, Strain Caron Lab Isolate" /LENGTH=515 /DNA_ID=CAMNT_0027551027 /DNA_START=102 /DNA_END=1649 /DNA_ORIENTATION=-
MAYAYWKGDRANDHAVFDLFYRKPPFKGEYCVFAGLEEVLRFVETYKFLPSHVEYLKDLMPACEDAFFDWMMNIDCRDVKIYAMDEGMVAFPREPLIRVEGPLAIVQLLETTLLNLVNFPSLITTNAARMRQAAGEKKKLLEFGLRRAQGPDGAMSASKYSYIGGFDGTSNVLSGMLTGIPVKGTHAHSFVMSYSGFSDLSRTTISNAVGKQVEFLELVKNKRKALGSTDKPNDGELAAFVSYAQSFPKGFLALVDTYDTLMSGVPNFLAVGWALHDLGFQPLGIRLDSGDLAYLSMEARRMFREADRIIGENIFETCSIIASNDINEDVLLSLGRCENEIDVFAIGTNLVTCQSQPALGCVFKLVELNGQPRIKLSQEVEKTVIPGRKDVYRLTGPLSPCPLIDLIQLSSEEPPKSGQRILCRHPFQENKRAHIVPAQVTPLLSLKWDGQNGGRQERPQCVETLRTRVVQQIRSLRADHLRPLNPTPYKVSLNSSLYDFMHQLWMSEAPISDLT